MDVDGWRPDPEAEHRWLNDAAPHWEAWRGVNDLYYARRPMSSPPKVVRAGSLAALLPAIRRAYPGAA